MFSLLTLVPLFLPGQELAVVEAMKMENVLRAQRDGVVTKIHAEPGAFGAGLGEYRAAFVERGARHAVLALRWRIERE